MKNVALFLSLFLVSLLSAKDCPDTLLFEEGVGMESVLQAEPLVGYILPVLDELPDADEANVDTESFARQCRVLGRGCRSFSVQQMLWEKCVDYRAAKKYLDILSHTITQVYTSLPCQNWAVPSEHYVFGMRHILI